MGKILRWVQIKLCNIIFYLIKRPVTASHRVMYANERETPVSVIHLWHFLSVHLAVWHFMTLCGSTFFCLPHIFTPSLPKSYQPPKAFWGFKYLNSSCDVKFNPFWNESVRILVEEKAQYYFAAEDLCKRCSPHCTVSSPDLCEQITLINQQL